MAALAHLTRMAIAADDAWQAALETRYGRTACNARYDARGKATPELKRLCNDKRIADHACACAWSELRGDTPPALVLVD